MRIVFVCSGNICRSPMAAEYARRRAANAGLSHLVVESAGLLGIEGERASREAVRVLREHGLDLSAHRSRGLRSSDARTAELLIVMTRTHLEEIAERFPAAAARTVLLRAFETGPVPSSLGEDLDDPIGLPEEVYRSEFETIRRCVDHLLLHLKHAP